MAGLSGRIGRIERALIDLGAERCPVCLDGNGGCGTVIRWCRVDGTHRDEPQPDRCFDQEGHCRDCGRYCGRVVLRMMEETDHT